MDKPTYSQELLRKAREIKLLICDVDGVLSNGQVIIGNQGEELKTFNIKDGLGLKSLMNHKVNVGHQTLLPRSIRQSSRLRRAL